MLEEKLHSDTNITPFGIIIPSCQRLHLRCQALPCLCLSVKSQPAVDIHICTHTQTRTHTRTHARTHAHWFRNSPTFTTLPSCSSATQRALMHVTLLSGTLSASTSALTSTKNKRKACGRGNREVNRCPTRRQGTVAQRRLHRLLQDGVSLNGVEEVR